MAKFLYNNTKNTSIVYILFKLNYGYYFCVSFEENVNHFLKSKSVKKLSVKILEFALIYCDKPFCVQKLQKQGHNKAVKPRSYASDNKV